MVHRFLIILSLLAISLTQSRDILANFVHIEIHLNSLKCPRSHFIVSFIYVSTNMPNFVSTVSHLGLTYITADKELAKMSRANTVFLYASN